MGKIVAIGGGDLRQNDTYAIDEFIVEFSGSSSPKALFIPTASGDSQGYVDAFNAMYRDQLNCDTDALMLISGELSDSEIEDKIMSADIIYVGGGNTKAMIDIWKKNKVDVYLHNAYEKGTVLCGLSAGAICWFKYGHSDSDKFAGEEGWEYIWVEGLGFHGGIICPHYNEEGRNGFDKMMGEMQLPGIALDNNCAIVIKDDEYKIIKSNETANAYLLKNEGGIVTKTLLSGEDYLPISNLLL